jgi:hypothetical protein
MINVKLRWIYTSSLYVCVCVCVCVCVTCQLHVGEGRGRGRRNGPRDPGGEGREWEITLEGKGVSRVSTLAGEGGRGGGGGGGPLSGEWGEEVIGWVTLFNKGEIGGEGGEGRGEGEGSGRGREQGSREQSPPTNREGEEEESEMSKPSLFEWPGGLSLPVQHLKLERSLIKAYFLLCVSCRDNLNLLRSAHMRIFLSIFSS